MPLPPGCYYWRNDLPFMDSRFDDGIRKKGPFGLEMGLKKSDYPGSLLEVESRPGCYQTKDVPKSHSAFEDYILQFGQLSGLCWIKAIGKTIDSNSFGTNIQTAFDEMYKKLVKAYGTSEDFSFLMEGSIWDEPRDWMEALLCGDRILAARWEATADLQLPNHLASIFLVASALDTSSGYIAIEYSFKNKESADEEVAALEDDAL